MHVAEGGGDRVGPETDERHAAGEAVGTIHEVVQVRVPGKREREYHE